MGNCFCPNSPSPDPTPSPFAIPDDPNKIITFRPDTAEVIGEKERLKFILLGTGDSGKTTLFKQMNINYARDYKPEKLLEEKESILKSLLTNFSPLINAIRSKFGSLGNEELDQKFDNLYADHKKMRFSPEVGELMRQVWSTKEAQEVWEDKSNFQIVESLEYFCQNLDRLISPEYIPTEKDYLLCRISTIGVKEQTFSFRDVLIFVNDVGGQRCERKKWLQCMDGCNAVVFVAAISEFDQKLFEDEKVNRLAEALTLFEKTCRFPLLENSRFALFLNKVDLFEKKMAKFESEKRNLDEFFPSLKLGTNYQGAGDKIKEHIRQEFLKRGPQDRISTHFITATDKENFKLIFDTAVNVVLNQAIDTHLSKRG